MEFQQITNAVIGVGMSILGWFARELWSAGKDLKNDVSNLREHLPRTYVSREDYRADIKEVKALLMGIVERLGEKANR
jgi:hypothetical protein